MKNAKVILLMLAIISVSVFAVQNSETVTLHFLTYKMGVSQALIIILSAAMGVLIGLGLSILKSFRDSRDIKLAKNEAGNMQIKLVSAEKENANLHLQVKNLEDKITQLEKGLEEKEDKMKEQI